jgi:hypothetical protein
LLPEDQPPPESSSPESETEPTDGEEKPAGPPGFWSVPGTENSWIKLGGFAMLDVIYDFDAIGSEDDFVPSTIPVGDGTDVEGEEGRTNFSFRQTRLQVDARKMVERGMIQGYVSGDLFGGTPEDPQLRVRQAYLRLEGLVVGGDFTAGQAWSYFVDPTALPETLDYEVASGSIFLRQPLVGWRREFGRTEFLVSFEEPSSDVTGADGLTRLPDAIIGGRWKEEWGHLKIAALGRQIRASFDGGPVATTLAGGLTFSGQVEIGKRGDNLSFQISGGEGMGRYIDDSVDDAIYDPDTGELETIPKRSGYVSYQHWWSKKVRTNLVYSAVHIDNLDVQTPDELRGTQYALVDLIWSPYKFVDLGIEALFGERQNKDRQSGSANRIQMSAKYSF